MDHLIKHAPIADYVAKIENGTSWEEFQTQLAAIPGFHQRDIVSTSFKVMNALDVKYGKTIENQLARSGNVVLIDNLHETVVSKFIKRKTIHTKIKHRRSIFRDTGRFSPEEIAGGIITLILVTLKMWMMWRFK